MFGSRLASFLDQALRFAIGTFIGQVDFHLSGTFRPLAFVITALPPSIRESAALRIITPNFAPKGWITMMSQSGIAPPKATTTMLASLTK